MLIALLDEYRKVANEYKKTLSTISSDDFEKIVDTKTQDSDCYSIQTITHHIIQSGYIYSNYITALNNKDWNNYKIRRAAAQEICDRHQVVQLRGHPKPIYITALWY